MASFFLNIGRPIILGNGSASVRHAPFTVAPLVELGRGASLARVLLRRSAFILAAGFILEAGSLDRSKDEASSAEEPDLFPMIYVNKVENLAGGPTRGMPRRYFRTLAGLTTPTLVHAQSPPHPSPTPTPANRSPLLTVFYSFSLSIDRCSAGIMILRRLGSQG